MVLVAVAYFISSVVLLVISMDMFMLGFSMSWAGIFWVLISEMFSMNVKSPASSMATATLFAAGALVDWAFLGLMNALGGGSFLVYACVAFASGVFVFVVVPETKGRTLAEIQRMLGSPTAAASGGLRSATSVPTVPLVGAVNGGGSHRKAGGAARSASGTPLSAQEGGPSPREEEMGGGGVAAWWGRTSRAVRGTLAAGVPRFLLRRRFDRMEGGAVSPRQPEGVAPHV